MTLRISTNGRRRPLYTVAELPLKLQADFSYISVTDNSRRIVLYKGTLYDVYDSQNINRELGFDQFKGWHGIVSETFFSGVLFKLCDDDHCICGRYFS